MSQIALSTSRNNWKKIGKERRAGVWAPLFSLYSEKSAGIGDFDDLKKVFDWCGKSGLTIFQLLPMNEVGPTFCPYDAISSFALEPMYISIGAEQAADLKKKFPAGRKYVDYGIKKAKIDILKKIYSNSARDRAAAQLEEFISENKYWIDDFALFKTLKARNKGAAWYQWPDAYKLRSPEALGAFRKKHAREIEFEKWAQWIAFGQLRAAKKYAASKGIFICGDLPILTSLDSADVWAHQEFFKLELSAGAPPDMYCAKGQRWSMPTYNWDRIAGDGYRYLKEKLKTAENFYDILRIDHVVGLFRVWSIPRSNPPEDEGLNGFFDPADENTWKAHGENILSIMTGSTSMLLLAEDLGVIPKDCPETLKNFEIPGNNVQRWTKDWAVSHNFIKPEDYRLFSVAMLSTHDTTNWAAWWENEAGTIDEELFVRMAASRGIDSQNAMNKLFDPKRSKHGRLRWRENINSSDMPAADFIEMYENTYMEKEKLWRQMGLEGPMREKSDPGIMKAALNITLSSSSIFCIEGIMDYLYLSGAFTGDAYKARINRPGTVSKENWSFVVPLSLEELLKNKIGAGIKDMISVARGGALV